jgi:DNA (cytosine-5)-methyltransferase 1
VVNTTRRRTAHRDFVLVSRYFKHIQKNRPKIFMLENVPLLAKEPVIDQYISALRKKFGYSIQSRIIRYSDFGAPTKRRRFLLFGSRIGEADEFFDELEKRKCKSSTVKDVIWPLRNRLQNELPNHIWPKLNTIDKYLYKYKTGKFGWYILNWNEPAPSFGNVMKTYILHPDAFSGGEKRVISVKEASLIMGFDTSFQFPDDHYLGKKYQMVVDSVSPVFSRIAAEIIKADLLTEADHD